MNYTVEVTDNDIAAAAVGERCPIEYAADRALGLEGVIVTRYRLLPDMDRNWVLPPKAREFVRRFDAGQAVHPFSFRLAPRS